MSASPFYRLIIDTSSEKSILAITCHSAPIASSIRPHANQLSKELIPSLQELLIEAKIDLNALNEIAVGVGPGSYTGTRVGVMIAKSLYFALQSSHSIQLRGFCSLLQSIPLQNGICLFAMPSKAGGIYFLKTLCEEGKISLLQSSLASKEKILEEIEDADLLIGKPLNQIEPLLPDLKWTLPEPSLESILSYLQNTAPCSSTDLIYLHTP